MDGEEGGGDVDQYGEQAGGLKQKMKGEFGGAYALAQHLAPNTDTGWYTPFRTLRRGTKHQGEAEQQLSVHLYRPAMPRMHVPVI